MSLTASGDDWSKFEINMTNVFLKKTSKTFIFRMTTITRTTIAITILHFLEYPNWANEIHNL